VVLRASRAALVDEVAVATSTAPGDDAVAERAAALGVACARGSEDDVLDRYRSAAEALGAGVVVRVTADCPMIDPGLIDATVAALRDAEGADFAANTLERSYPRGLDVEVATRGCLERAWREAREPWERAHVFPYVYAEPGRFRLVSVRGDEDHSAHRWTVDTAEDLAMARALCARLPGGGLRAGWREALAAVGREPGIAHLNARVAQKEPAAG
jgi:spore coat polysaccharide biosynthesis protein SpsF